MSVEGVAYWPQKVLVCIPAYSGQINLPTFKSLLQDIMLLVANGVAVEVIDEIGGAEIDTIRNKFISRFAADPDATDLVMVDSDVCWQPGGLVQLLCHDVDFVAGAYPKRSEPLDFPLCPIDGKKDEPINLVNGLMECNWVAGGFMRMRKAVALKMIESYPELETVVGWGEYETKGYPVYALFDHLYEEVDGLMKRASEDVSFCFRYRKVGGQVWVDPSIKMGHIGTKMYSGVFGYALTADGEKVDIHGNSNRTDNEVVPQGGPTSNGPSPNRKERRRSASRSK